MLLHERPPRKPPKAKEIAFLLPSGQLTFRKKDMSGATGTKPRNVLVLGGKRTPVLPGPAAPLDGILRALPDSMAGLIVRQAIERGSVTWTPSTAATPRLSTRETRDPVVSDTKAVRATYDKIAAALVAEIDEAALLGYLEARLAPLTGPGRPSSGSGRREIVDGDYKVLSDHPTPDLAPILGRFNGFSFLPRERLYPWLGFGEGWCAMMAAELTADVNWCRVIQDEEGSAHPMYPVPELTFDSRYDAPALRRCWVRPQYRATSSAVEAAALLAGVPALSDPALTLPTISLTADGFDGVAALRWVCADHLTLMSSDGAVRQSVAVPLRVESHADLAASFDGEMREQYEQAARGADGDGGPLALHPVALGALPAYLARSPEAYAHALLDVACAHADPGKVLTHLLDPVDETYFRVYPVNERTYRAALVQLIADGAGVHEAIEARVVATVARLARIAELELAPLLTSARSLGIVLPDTPEHERLVDLLRAAARKPAS